MEVDFREAVRKFSLMYLCSFKWFSFELAYIRTRNLSSFKIIGYELLVE